MRVHVERSETAGGAGGSHGVGNSENHRIQGCSFGRVAPRREDQGADERIGRRDDDAEEAAERIAEQR